MRTADTRLASGQNAREREKSSIGTLVKYIYDEMSRSGMCTDVSYMRVFLTTIQSHRWDGPSTVIYSQLDLSMLCAYATKPG